MQVEPGAGITEKSIYKKWVEVRGISVVKGFASMMWERFFASDTEIRKMFDEARAKRETKALWQSETKERMP